MKFFSRIRGMFICGSVGRSRGNNFWANNLLSRLSRTISLNFMLLKLNLLWGDDKKLLRTLKHLSCPIIWDFSCEICLSRRFFTFSSYGRALDALTIVYWPYVAWYFFINISVDEETSFIAFLTLSHCPAYKIALCCYPICSHFTNNNVVPHVFHCTMRF